MATRYNFSFRVMALKKMKPEWLSRILLTDETYFILNGEVNTQNCRIGSAENPQEIVFTKVCMTRKLPFGTVLKLILSLVGNWSLGIALLSCWRHCRELRCTKYLSLLEFSSNLFSKALISANYDFRVMYFCNVTGS